MTLSVENSVVNGKQSKKKSIFRRFVIHPCRVVRLCTSSIGHKDHDKLNSAYIPSGHCLHLFKVKSVIYVICHHFIHKKVPHYYQN